MEIKYYSQHGLLDHQRINHDVFNVVVKRLNKAIKRAGGLYLTVYDVQNYTSINKRYYTNSRAMKLINVKTCDRALILTLKKVNTLRKLDKFKELHCGSILLRDDLMPKVTEKRFDTVEFRFDYTSYDLYCNVKSHKMSMSVHNYMELTITYSSRYFKDFVKFAEMRYAASYTDNLITEEHDKFKIKVPKRSMLYELVKASGYKETDNN